ncbi:uncharacterized protein LOC129588250 isoform X2 [Paramacrobiotus metropolitanus]|nr:uncharacterized protein LOC129588250 isoform X2 [Paramacrobiotus metropolitanus]
MLSIWPVKDTSDGLLQGDIAGIDPSTVIGVAHTQANAVKDESLLWPNSLVPYEMSRSVSNSQTKFIKEAMAGIEAKTCIRFVPRKYEDDYLAVVAGTSCHSMVGRQGSRQEIAMHRGCQDGFGATQHEFLHALGFFHEHARPDRDKYITINTKNLEGGDDTAAQFKAQTAQAATTLDTPYDYESAMHYGWNVFSRNRNYPTILPKQKGAKIGQRQKLSDMDILRINKLYKCKDYLIPSQPPPANISTVAYDENLQNWAVLCNGIVEMDDGWDENPDVCLKLCDKIDNDLYKNAFINERERYSGKVLYNAPTTKQCSKKAYLCDGIKKDDKDDSEDINVCQQFCKGGGYVAIAPTYMCVHFLELCNGKKANKFSGGDGSDEIKDNCIKYCGDLDKQEGGEQKYFNLEPSGQCLMKDWLCDGRTHAPKVPTNDRDVCQKYCTGGGYFPTGDTSQCIHYTWLCDGRNDTTTGWDEIKQNCLDACPKVPEMDGELFNMDPSGQCIHKRQLCNGHKLETGSAPTNMQDVCIKYCQGNLYFPMPDTNQCLKATDLCDGKKDTDSGWDETNKNCVSYCRKMNTSKNLLINPKTKRCSVRQL